MNQVDLLPSHHEFTSTYYAKSKINHYLCTGFNQGVMLEWLKRHAWKACIRQKRIGGSNPPLSARKSVNQAFARFTLFFSYP